MYILDFITFISNYISSFSPTRLWCIYDMFGMRSIFILINTGIVAFSIPNILEQHECNPDKDSYIKSLFLENKRRMRIASVFLIIFSILTVLVYLSLWSALENQKLCTAIHDSTSTPSNVIFVCTLPVLNISTFIAAYIAFKGKIYCMKHKK